MDGRKMGRNMVCIFLPSIFLPVVRASSGGMDFPGSLCRVELLINQSEMAVKRRFMWQP